MFLDRTDAGEQLADVVRAHGLQPDVVLAIPRGGLPVARVIADRLGAPLDIVVANKIGAPGRQELAIGAVAMDGTVWLNESVIDEWNVSREYIDDAVEHERRAAQEKAKRYREDKRTPELAGKTVLVVDDGIATGATATACLRQVRNAGAERVVLAVPVGPPDTIERLQSDADEVISVETPPHFSTVGQFYEDFEQVPDDEVLTYLG